MVLVSELSLTGLLHYPKRTTGKLKSEGMLGFLIFLLLTLVMVFIVSESLGASKRSFTRNFVALPLSRKFIDIEIN